jgi:trehalose/maltose hydrolase-like predicted phosphorylase
MTRGRPVGAASTLRMTLDLRRGLLFSDGRQSVGPAIGLRLRTLRLVSLRERAIGLQLVHIEAAAGEVDIDLEAFSDGVSLTLAPEHLEADLVVWRTKHSGKRLAAAATSLLEIDGREVASTGHGLFHRRWRWMARPGEVACLTHFVAVVRSDVEGLDPGPDARGKLEIVRQLGWRGVIAEHEAAWTSRWQCSDVEIDGDAKAQRALRFALYHLNSAANPADEHVSIAARALTGDDYRGHVFWDTEIYLLPFYTLTWPQAARALLMYRFHTLDAARAKASRLGWRGALYAWESAATGAETAPEHATGPDGQPVEILAGKEEQHVSADIAYAVWQYWLANEDFLRDAGAEILLETGRFWASRAQLEADGRRHIRGVIGPDEYHDNIDDNAFTNNMARWNIGKALEAACLLRERWPKDCDRLALQLGLDESELQQLGGCRDDCDGARRPNGALRTIRGLFRGSNPSISRTMRIEPSRWTWYSDRRGRAEPR